MNMSIEISFVWILLFCFSMSYTTNIKELINKIKTNYRQMQSLHINGLPYDRNRFIQNAMIDLFQLHSKNFQIWKLIVDNNIIEQFDKPAAGIVKQMYALASFLRVIFNRCTNVSLLSHNKKSQLHVFMSVPNTCGYFQVANIIPQQNNLSITYLYVPHLFNIRLTFIEFNLYDVKFLNHFCVKYSFGFPWESLSALKYKLNFCLAGSIPTQSFFITGNVVRFDFVIMNSHTPTSIRIKYKAVENKVIP